MINSYCQEKILDYNFGVLNSDELEMLVYDKDSAANAVVLFEQSKTIFTKEKSEIYIETTIYRKIKLFTNDGFENANIKVRLYNNENIRERIKNINAVTHSNGKTITIKRNAIFKKKINDHFTEITFIMPEITVGSVIEYTYTIKSPFIYNFTNWDFQSSIPKVKSVFKAEIPVNYLYNRKISGPLKLSVNEALIKKNCSGLISSRYLSDCEVIRYEMENIPAFIEENFITSKKNYISKISFKLSRNKNFNGVITNRPLTWEDIDKGFKEIHEIKSQFNRTSFFSKQIPQSIQDEKDTLKKAKDIYHFIQQHFIIDKEFKLFENINVRNAFKKGKGGLDEINLALINSFNACNIDAELVLVSTRSSGLPTKEHAVITDFNYIIVKIDIGNKTYFLDASDKQMPFGIVPFRCLNGDSRVMNIDKGSYWEEVIPTSISQKKVFMLLKFNSQGNFDGQMRVIHSGYEAINRRKEFNELKKEKYINAIENNSESLEVVNYKNFNLDEIEKMFKEEFEIIIENDATIDDYIYLNPFFNVKVKENPFKLDERLYPIDFGYPKKFDYLLSMEIPKGYEVESLPKNKIVNLPNGTGQFIYKIDSDERVIRINFKYDLNKSKYNSDEYQYLKEFYNQMILSQNEPIVFLKK